MDKQVNNRKNQLPTQKLWKEFESNRLLLEPRKKIVASIFRLVAIASLVVYVPWVLVLGWAILVFGSNFWMQQSIRTYSQLLENPLNQTVMTPALSAVVHRYKQAWLVNCFIWGGLGFLSQFWLPDAPRLVCVVILNALMYLSITRTCVDRTLMHRVSAVLVLVQAFFVFLRYILLTYSTNIRPDGTDRFLAYVFYLSLMLYLLWVVGNRFNQMHLQRLDSEYANLQLIETLNQNKTQLHLEQQALVASNKLVQQFYSGAAHDLRQPVYAMQLYASMLSDDASLGKVLLPKITQSCESINDMFNTLFDYQQTHMNDIELAEKDICIREVFKSLALNFQPIATGKGLDIRFKPIAGSVNMVPLYLTRILSNLITNGLRYTRAGGVLVSARRTSAGIKFQVWDTGIGIDDSKTRQIFNEFYKINKVDIENEGLGLGLAIAKQLLARIPNADISVRSRVARGSVFTLTVPLERYKPSL